MARASNARRRLAVASQRAGASERSKYKYSLVQPGRVPKLRKVGPIQGRGGPQGGLTGDDGMEPPVPSVSVNSSATGAP